jgi:hypothetical protein
VIPNRIPSATGRRTASWRRVAPVVALTAAAVVLLSGCTGSTPTPTFTGEGARYFTLVHERYGKCLDDMGAASYAYNPGGIDPRQVGTVEVSGKKDQLYWAVVTPIKKGDALLTVPDASTADRLKSAGC